MHNASSLATREIDKSFVQSKECVKIFKLLLVAFFTLLLADLLSLLSQLADLINYSLLLRIIGWGVIAYGMTLLFRLAPSTASMCVIGYTELALLSGFQLRYIPDPAIILSYLAILLLPYMFVWQLHSMIIEISMVVDDNQIKKRARLLRKLFLLTPLALLLIYVFSIPLFDYWGPGITIWDKLNHLGTEFLLTGGIAFILFAAVVLIQILNIRLLLNTAKMCRTFTTTQQSPPQPEAQNV